MSGVMAKLLLYKIDRLALGTMFILGILIGGLIWAGQNCGTFCLAGVQPHIQDFSWQEQRLGASDRAFILTFDRPMDKPSVEKNLRITPPLPGKISWAGRRLAYTLTNPIPYGESYQLTLKGARAKSNQGEKPHLSPFVGNFASRDRAFAYIATTAANSGQLILHNFTQKRTLPLTPSDLVVFDFQFYPQGDKILFAAAPRSRGSQGLRELDLYSVTTGLNAPLDAQFRPQLTRILDSETYQNNQFELAADGKTIVVSRLHRTNPNDFGLWLVRSGQAPRPLNIQGGQFSIAPDSQTLAVAKGEGISFLPLNSGDQTLDFLPNYGRVLDFSNDGSAAVMVKFNTDSTKLRYTKTLVYINNQGLQKPLLNVDGSILDCKFNPSASKLYCLLTQLILGKTYQEIPYFAKIDIQNKQVTPLLELPNYRDIKISLSPDGLAILFDQVKTSSEILPHHSLSSDSGETIVDSRLWLLFPTLEVGKNQEKPALEELPLAGFRPQWAP
jgi:hypothetical protein